MVEDIITKIVNSICGGIILTQIGEDRIKLEEVVVKAIQKGFWRKEGRYFSHEKLKVLSGIIGYGIQEKTGVDFGYCGEECMNGNGDMGKKITCHHVKALCEYKVVEQSLGKYSENIPFGSGEINTDLLIGALYNKISEEEGMNASSPGHSAAMFFCSEDRQGLEK